MKITECVICSELRAEFEAARSSAVTAKVLQMRELAEARAGAAMEALRVHAVAGHVLAHDLACQES